jgi:hypothetical protein
LAGCRRGKEWEATRNIQDSFLEDLIMNAWEEETAARLAAYRLPPAAAQPRREIVNTFTNRVGWLVGDVGDCWEVISQDVYRRESWFKTVCEPKD